MWRRNGAVGVLIYTAIAPMIEQCLPPLPLGTRGQMVERLKHGSIRVPSPFPPPVFGWAGKELSSGKERCQVEY